MISHQIALKWGFSNVDTRQRHGKRLSWRWTRAFEWSNCCLFYTIKFCQGIYFAWLCCNKNQMMQPMHPPLASCLWRSLHAVASVSSALINASFEECYLTYAPVLVHLGKLESIPHPITCTEYCFKMHIYPRTSSQFRVPDCCTSAFWRHQVPRCTESFRSSVEQRCSQVSEQKGYTASICCWRFIFNYEWNKMMCSECSYLL